MNKKNAKPIVAIVDGYSTGNKISPILRKKGISVTHIQSEATIPPLLAKSYNPGTFDDNIIHENIKKTADIALSKGITHIVAGSETGVILADHLNYHLGLKYKNRYDRSESRRDKFKMIETVRDHGIKAVHQIKSSNFDEIVSWSLTKASWPLVVKPINSSSSDGLSFVNNENELSVAIDQILGKKNILGIVNDEVLVQETLMGEQYVVNTVSHSGTHYLTDVWKMTVRHTKEMPMIIDAMELIDCNHPAYLSLTQYTKDSLTSLGIEYGPAHTEVMMTDSGPSLIEVNSRLMGGNIDACFRDALEGYDQIDALIDSIIDPERLKKNRSRDYNLSTNLVEIDFVFYQSGILIDIPKYQYITKLDSFLKFSNLPAIDSYVRETSDTTNQAGLLYLKNSDPEKLQKDVKAVLEWQYNNSIFTIEKE
jgi:biotin carboxylase